MKRTVAFSLIFAALATAGAMPARAEYLSAPQALSGAEILFGKNYHDNVDAIQVQPSTSHYDGLPLSVTVATPAHMRQAQAQAQRDPDLMRALSARNIALHNVIEVDTTGTGSKVVYYY